MTFSPPQVDTTTEQELIPRLLRWGSLTFVALNVGLLMLVFSTGSPPPHLDDPKLSGYLHDHAALFGTVTIVSYLSLVGFVAFVAALRSIIRRAMGTDWLADAAAVLGAAFIAIAFVDFGIMASAQAYAASGGDPATVRTLEELGRSLGNLPSSLEWALLMAAVSLAIRITGMMPRWVGTVGWIGVGIILLTAGSVYVTDSHSFFAADSGIGLAGTLVLLVWMTCVALAPARRDL